MIRITKEQKQIMMQNFIDQVENEKFILQSFFIIQFC